MKTQIRFTYTENQIPKRCRKPRRVALNDTFEGEVREITGDQAPIAIVAKFDELGVPQEVPYRWFEGALWTAIKMVSCRPRGYTSGQDDWDHQKIPDRLDLSAEAGSSAGYYYGLTGLPHWESREVVEEFLRQRLHSSLLIDGVPHLPVGEPRYVVMTFGLSHNHGGTSIHATDHYNSNIAEQAYFSLLEAKQAIAYATRVATDRGDTESLPMRIEEQFEVRIKEAIQCGRKTEPAPQLACTGTGFAI